MARYIDADALIAEYDRVHIGPAGGARKLMVDAPTADVVPRAELAVGSFRDAATIYNLQERLKEANKEIATLKNIQRLYAEREANVKGFTEDLDRLGKEVEKLTVELEAMRGAANSYKMHYENLARAIFGEIEDLLQEWFDFFRQDDCIRESCAIMAALSQVTERKKKYIEGAAADGDKQ